jgi:P4 family phage/plasmid primase-like protien
MKLTIYTANVTGMESNCRYPNKVVITNADELKTAVTFDHVCAQFKNAYRSIAGFVCTDCQMKDNDNDHSDDPDDWIYPEQYADIFPDINYAVIPSRNNMKQKGDKSPRPRHHIVFPITETTSADAVKKLQRDIQKQFPFFDKNAQDAARFYFGCQADNIIWHEGSMNIDDYLALAKPNDIIKEGSRNATLSRFAGRILKRFGDTDKAYQLFLEEADKCENPLDDAELTAIWNSALKFYNRIKKSPDYVPPEEYTKQNPLVPTDFSDIGEAKIFVQEYGEELCFTEATGYLRYNGTYWAESDELALGAAIEFMDLQLSDALSKYTAARKALEDAGLTEKEVVSKKFQPDEEQKEIAREFIFAKEYYDFVMKRRNMRCIKPMLEAAKPMLFHDISEFDNQEFLLNTPGATYDLRFGMDGRSEHNAKDYLTKVTRVEPTYEGMEIWEEALQTFFCGDSSLIEYAQEQAGLSIIGKVFNESLQMAHGEGSNGKSTYYNVQAKVCGSYAGTISADSLTASCRRNIKPEMAELKGKRLVIAAELEEGMRLNTSAIKQLCSTDKISAEKKYEKPFDFEPTHTLVLYTNHLPKVGASDRGTWRRIIVIPFNASIEGGSDIKNYADYLFEHAGGAILAWMIEGAKKIIEKKFATQMPDVVKNAIAVYRENNDWFNAFLDECCEVEPTYMAKSGELYQEYRSYCQRMGEYTRSTTDFYAELESQGFERKKTMKGIMVKGLAVKSDFLD